MRIIGGEFGRRVLRTPADLEVRPTTDLAKEALFNILANRIDFFGIKVADLFAGTGSIGMEFASRQAGQVICVESDTKNATFIMKASSGFGMSNIKVLQADVFKVLQSIGADFDIIFSDPPFQLENLETIPSLVLNAGILKPGGILIVEHGPKHSFALTPGFEQERRYGKVRFSFFIQTGKSG